MPNLIEITAEWTTWPENKQRFIFNIPWDTVQDIHDILSIAHTWLEDKMNINPMLKISEYEVTQIKIWKRVIDITEWEEIN